jgi:hypothetical protein
MPPTIAMAPAAQASSRAGPNRWVNRKATTPGITRELKTISTPATSTEKAITIPNGT